MISLLSILKRFYAILRIGWSEAEFRALALILGAWIALGTIVYSIYEDWTVTEAFYFCVMSLTTIGYGDYTPTTWNMQLYTVAYTVLGIGFFVSFSTMLVRIAWTSRATGDDNDTGPAAISE